MSQEPKDPPSFPPAAEAMAMAERPADSFHPVALSYPPTQQIFSYQSTVPYGAPPTRTSGVGNASLVIGILSLVAALGGIGGASWIRVYWTQPGAVGRPDKGMLILLGFVLLGSLLVAIVGSILGLIGVLQRDRPKGSAIAGLVANVAVLAIVCGLMVFGNAVRR